MGDERTFAPDWTPEERAQWKADYAADRPVLLPHAEHDSGECEHCDLLRQLMCEVDEGATGACTTHHACDCIQARLREVDALAKELARALRVVTILNRHPLVENLLVHFDCLTRVAYIDHGDWPPGVSDGLTLPCADCGQIPQFDYRVTDDFWRRYVPERPAGLGVVCLPCLDRRCGGEGLPEALDCVQWVGTGHTIEMRPARAFVYEARIRAANEVAAEMEQLRDEGRWKETICVPDKTWRNWIDRLGRARPSTTEEARSG